SSSPSLARTAAMGCLRGGRAPASYGPAPARANRDTTGARLTFPFTAPRGQNGRAYRSRTAGGGAGMKWRVGEFWFEAESYANLGETRQAWLWEPYLPRARLGLLVGAPR